MKLDTEERTKSAAVGKSYQPPFPVRVGREGNEELYQLEEELHRLIERCAALVNRAVGGVVGADFFHEQLPLYLYQLLDGWDSQAATLGAAFYLQRRGFHVLTSDQAATLGALVRLAQEGRAEAQTVAGWDSLREFLAELRAMQVAGVLERAEAAAAAAPAGEDSDDA